MTIDWTDNGPAPELDLTEIAALPTSTTSGIIRRSLAEEALEDDLWMISYRSRRSEGLRPVEQLPVLPPETLEAYRRLTAEAASEQPDAALGRKFGAPAASVLGAIWGLLLLANPWASPGFAAMFSRPTDFSVGEHFLLVLSTGALLGVLSREVARRTSPWMSVALLTWAGFALGRYAPLLVCMVAGSRVVFVQNRVSILSKMPARFSKTIDTRAPRPESRTAVDKMIRPIADDLLPSWIQNTPRTRWGAPVRTPHGAAWELARRAEGYGVDIVDVTSIDAVAAVLGAEAWLAATGASTFEQAASLGPVSLGSLATIYARAAGQGLECLAPVPGEKAWPAQEHNLRVLLEDPMRWAIRQLGPVAAADALRIAASDMAANGGGDDRCTRAARWMHEAADSYGARRP